MRSLCRRVGLVCLLAAGLAAQAPPPATIRLPLQQATLANGLRVILSPDSSAPTVSLSLTYDVGSRNERKGHTGFAHLFEHLMFEGTPKVPKGQFFTLISTYGANMNGTTNQDRTNYFETLPANQLDLGLYLEADRMRSLPEAMTQAKLDNQRQAVEEERRLRTDNVAYGRSDELVHELAYDNFAYQHPVVGSMKDLNAASLADVVAFFKTYYLCPQQLRADAGGRLRAERGAGQGEAVFWRHCQPAAAAAPRHVAAGADERAPPDGDRRVRAAAAHRDRLPHPRRQLAGLVCAERAGRYPHPRAGRATQPVAGADPAPGHQPERQPHADARAGAVRV